LIKGGQHLEVVYEPGTPFGSDASGDEVQGADIGDAVRDEDIQGKKSLSSNNLDLHCMKQNRQTKW
jgi:hypothetical protein